MVKKNTSIEIVISYADKTYGHEGVIYKASNFQLVGQTKPHKVIQYGDRTYHDKAIRTKYRGELKPFAKKIKKALESGEAFYTDTKEKNIYIYDLNRGLSKTQIEKRMYKNATPKLIFV